MAYEHITIATGGIPYEGWEYIVVESDVDKPYVSFIAGTTEISEPHEIGSAFDNWNFPPGAPLEVYADSTLVVSAKVTEYNPSATADQHSITLRGDTYAIDATQSSIEHPTGTYQQTTDIDILRQVFRQFGTDILTFATPREIPRFQIRPGATAYAEMMRLLQHGKLLIGRPHGNAIAVTDGVAFHGGGLLLHGVNMISQSAILTDEAHYKVRALGQDPLGVDVQKHLKPYGEAFNHGQRRTGRLKVIVDQIAARPEVLQARAEWEKNRSMGRTTRAFIRTPGWRSQDGNIWDTNVDYTVVAPWLKIDAVMRTSKVTLIQNHSDGTVADLELVDPRAFGGQAGLNNSGAAWNQGWQGEGDTPTP